MLCRCPNWTLIQVSKEVGSVGLDYYPTTDMSALCTVEKAYNSCSVSLVLIN